MMSTIKEVQQKLCDRLVNTGWLEKLRFFVKTQEFQELLLALYMEKEEGHRFTPPLRDIFVPFELCHFKEAKVIVVNGEPYGNPLLNTGLAIQAADGSTYQHKALKKALDDRDFVEMAKKGTLWLNSTLTADITNPGQHDIIWKPFTLYLFEILNSLDTLAWVFIGENQYFKKVTNKNHLKIQLPQLPAFWNEEWDHQNAFARVKEYVDKNNRHFSW